MGLSFFPVFYLTLFPMINEDELGLGAMNVEDGKHLIFADLFRLLVL